MTKGEPRHISATEARVHFGALLDAVKEGEVVIVERNGHEAAVFVPMLVHQRIKERREHRESLTNLLARPEARTRAADAEETDD